jgi:hypothetical protein
MPVPIPPHGAVGQFRRYSCLVVMAILAFATWRRYSNWPAISDIGLWDETIYLGGGLSHTFDFAAYEADPLYQAYYYAVGLAIQDAKDVYFFGGLALQLTTLCSIGFVAWILSRSLAIATFTFGLILCSPFLLAWPRISYLAVIFVVWGCLLASLETRLANRLALTMLVSFLICFVRPEFVLTMYLSGGALLVVLFGWTVPEAYRVVQGRVQFESHDLYLYRLDLYRLGTYLSLFVVLCFAWSFPLLRGDQRAMEAFGQWYAVWWVSEHGSPLDPWLNWSSIVEKVFPGAASPAQALLSNPTEWIRSRIHNISAYPLTMTRLLLGRGSIVIAFGLFWLLSIAAWSMHNRMRSVIGLSSSLKTVPLVECGLYAAAPLVTMILVYPNAHYAVILLSALIPSCVAVGRWHSWSKVADLAIALLGALAIAVAARPLPLTDQPILQTIIELRNLNLPIRRMLEVDGGWCTYLKPPCATEFPSAGSADEATQGGEAQASVSTERMLETTTPLLKMVVDRRVDAILVSTRLRDFLRTRQDRSLDGLITDQSASGTEWRRYEIADGRYLLLYREMHP